MSKYSCEKCGMEFKQKSHYTQHLARKTPCIKEAKLKEYIDKAVEEKINVMKQTLQTPELSIASLTIAPITIAPLTIAPPTFIEVCAGGGGLSCGLMKAGFVPLLLNDNNKDCCETLKKNHPGIKVECASMDTLKLDEYIDKVDLLTGGVPCQSFSQAGKRKGLKDPRGELMLKFADMIVILKPKIFMIENVKGLTTHDGGKTLIEIIALLNKSDLYQVDYRVLNAAEFSVPQKRERVFIIGTLKTMDIVFNFPLKNSNPILLKHVLQNLPESPCAKYSAEKIALFKQIPQGGCWVNLSEEQQKAYLGKSYLSGGGKRGILHRLSMEKPSLTLLCTPSQKQTERCHPLEERPLSVREYARIQTFADDYHFTGGMASQYKQIGNAVPVELARQMGESLKTALLA